MNKIFYLIFALVVGTLGQESDFDPENLSGQELIDYVNSIQSSWRAELNERINSYNARVKYGLMGVNHVRNSVKARKHVSATKDLVMDIPESFDARENWPECESIKKIRDQSSCGSCWSTSMVEAASDRICIHSEGQIQVTLSNVDLLSCCKSCGFGCNGGDPYSAWKYFVKSGIVTGSGFKEHSGCRYYPFPNCEHHSNKTTYKPCQHDLYPTPKCEKKCQPGYTKNSYQQDKFYGRIAYSIKDDEIAIQKELMANGPIQVAFEVYDDFLNYKSGVYHHVGGKLGGGHAVKMIGWGIDNGEKYWLIANSWNEDWGENGFFRIRRGTDECGIESGAVAGIPKLKQVRGRYYNHVAVDEDSEEFFF